MNMFDLGGMLLRVGRAITPPDTRFTDQMMFLQKASLVFNLKKFK